MVKVHLAFLNPEWLYHAVVAVVFEPFLGSSLIIHGFPLTLVVNNQGSQFKVSTSATCCFLYRSKKQRSFFEHSYSLFVSKKPVNSHLNSFLTSKKH